MANGRVKLSVEGEQRLLRAMTELEINERPEVLRIALAKGLNGIDGEPEKKDRKPKWEIPEGVVARGEVYMLFKHLIINKIKKTVEGKELDDYFLRYIEEGLEIMEKEMNSLSKLDNYLLFLAQQHSV